MIEKILAENDSGMALKYVDKDFTWYEIIVFGCGSLHLEEYQWKEFKKMMLGLK